MAGGLFESYASAIADLPGGALTAADLMTDAFLLRRDGDLSIYYVPFERLNPRARVVLIGITPGFTQMRIAYEVARDGLAGGFGHEEILGRVDRTASFAGAMRANLNRMLDDLGLPALLGIDATDQLFAERSELMHSTSALRNPVFVAGSNYTGSAPPIATTPLLRSEILRTLGPELASVASAILIPLGRAAEEALLILIADGIVAPGRCCMGFPHPSGANGHRARLFAQQRDHLAHTLAAWFDSTRPIAPVKQQDLPVDDLLSRLATAVSAALTADERDVLAERLREIAERLASR